GPLLMGEELLPGPLPPRLPKRTTNRTKLPPGPALLRLSLAFVILSLLSTQPLQQRLQRETVLTYPRTPSPNYADQVLAGLKANDIEPARVRVLADLHSALSLAAAGMGVALIPLSVSKNARRDLTYVDVSALDLTSPVTVNCPIEGIQSDAQSLLDLITSLSASQEV
ncbi:MAG: LysR substrate-binding domain-containing protein, partial [Pseudomonadota bacterium]